MRWTYGRTEGWTHPLDTRGQIKKTTRKTNPVFLFISAIQIGPVLTRSENQFTNSYSAELKPEWILQIGGVD